MREKFMSIYVTSEMASSYIQYNLNKSTIMFNRSMEQLASGSRIIQSADSPIGVTDVSRVDFQKSGNSCALSNLELGTDLLQEAEDEQDLLVENIQRIRDLSMQAANETYSSSDKDSILAEIRARIDEVNRAADSVNFNGIKLLDGSANNLTIQAGLTELSSINVGAGLIDTHSAALGIDIPVGATGATWTTADVEAYLVQLDGALGTLTNSRSLLGAYSNRLGSMGINISNIDINLSAYRSTISDTDVAAASADIIKYQILQQAAVNILTQANQMPSRVVSLLSPS